MPLRLSIALITGGAFLLASILLAYIFLPEWLTNELAFQDEKDYHSFLAATRSSLAAILGSLVTLISALAALAALYATYRTYAVTKERNTADVLAKGTELLGAQAMSSRLGGIYALKRLASVSEPDYAPVMEILTGFLRSKCCSHSVLDARNSASEAVTSVEIQAIVSAIGERHAKARVNIRLNLAAVNLRKVSCACGDLRGVSFLQAKLEDLDFTNADLRGADFTEAELERCNFQGALMKDTVLFATQFVDVVHLSQAQLDKASGNASTLLPHDLVPPLHWSK